MLDAKDLPNRAAGRMADEVRAVDAEGIHDFQRISGHALDAVFHLLVRAGTCATMVVDDYREMLAQRADLRLPIAAGPAKAGDEQDWRPVTMGFVVNVGVINSDGWHGAAPG